MELEEKKKKLAEYLYESIKAKSLAFCKNLLESGGADPNYVMEGGIAPFHFAVAFETDDVALDFVRLCLQHGGDPNLRSRDDGMTPLMLAAFWKRPEILKLLLKFGGDPDLNDYEGFSAKDYAEQCGDPSVYDDIVHPDGYVTKRNKSSPIFDPHKENAKAVNLNSDFSDIESGHSYTEIFVPKMPSQFSTQSILQDCSQPSKDHSSPSQYQSFSQYQSSGASSRRNLNDAVLETTSSTLYSCHDDNCDCLVNDIDLPFKGLSMNDVPSQTEEIDLPLKELSVNLTPQNLPNDETPQISDTSSLSSCPTEVLKNELKQKSLLRIPVVASTKKLNLKILKMFEKSHSFVKKDQNDSCKEIRISTFDRSTLFEYLERGEIIAQELEKSFKNDSKSRYGQKVYFTYLLLDPRLTCKIVADLEEIDLWKFFIESIFYVGKGKDNRPLDHLKEAAKTMEAVSVPAKIKRIREIWSEGLGVVILVVFHFLNSSEAHIREAAMLDALKGADITNLLKGRYMLPAKVQLTKEEKRQFGVSLLYRAMKIYLGEGERFVMRYDL